MQISHLVVFVMCISPQIQNINCILFRYARLDNACNNIVALLFQPKPIWAKHGI